MSTVLALFRDQGVVSVYSEPDKVEEARRILLEEGAFEAAPIDAPMRKAS